MPPAVGFCQLVVGARDNDKHKILVSFRWILVGPRRRSIRVDGSLRACVSECVSGTGFKENYRLIQDCCPCVMYETGPLTCLLLPISASMGMQSNELIDLIFHIRLQAVSDHTVIQSLIMPTMYSTSCINSVVHATTCQHTLFH